MTWKSALVIREKDSFIQKNWSKIDSEKFVVSSNLKTLLDSISNYVGYAYTITNEIDSQLKNKDGAVVKWLLGRGFYLYESYKKRR